VSTLLQLSCPAIQLVPFAPGWTSRARSTIGGRPAEPPEPPARLDRRVYPRAAPCWPAPYWLAPARISSMPIAVGAAALPSRRGNGTDACSSELSDCSHGTEGGRASRSWPDETAPASASAAACLHSQPTGQLQ